jgi:subtilase-type serine protease
MRLSWGVAALGSCEGYVMNISTTKRHSALKVAASALAISLGAGLGANAAAQERPDGVWDEPNIVVNNNMTANGNPPTGAWDNTQNVTGVGQMTIRGNPATTGMNLCTGTLINPRTVIFAAHCVNTRPAEAYGSANGAAFGPWTMGGTPIAFGFEFDNLPAVRQWLGLESSPGAGDANPALMHATNEARHLYNVEHVWYDPRSLAPTSNRFLEADIAIATLDTPALGIPTWVMLFTPLSGPTHATITGYGGNGTSASVQAGPLPSGNTPIDWRRRAAENMIDFLGSLDDRNDWIFGPGGVVNPQTLYQLDFDSPGGENTYTGTAPNYDFDLFDGVMLPREGTTAGGDSGGPLIADQYFDTPVVVATLSGGSRFHTNQRFSTYGTNSFYQPLFLFWEEVVANNPYVYAGNKAGNRNWTDPSHWVQLMDPAYGIELAGALVNALPGVGSYGVSGDTPKFGRVCFQTDCTDNADDPTAVAYDVGTPNSIYVPGGPGTENFVPNNIVANPALGIRPRYYDVTLAASGVTMLSSAVTIDAFKMSNGYSTLNIAPAGSLSILGDANILAGWLNVDGVINSGEMVSVQGIITGTGLLNPTFLTSVAGAIAPNGSNVGTLTVQGDVVLASGNQLFIEVGRDGADLLRIIADAADGTAGNIGLGGDLRMVKASNGPAPRHGQTFTIVAADGAVFDRFDTVYAQTGVLRPEMVYNDDSVQIILRAGKFADVLEGNVHQLAFAHALDDLRAGSYGLLYNLYGELDVMDVTSLQRAFSALTPSTLLDANALLEMQGSTFGNTLSDRMSLLSRNGASGVSITGAPGQLLAFGGDEGLAAAGELAFASRMTEEHTIAGTPQGVSAFFTGGYDESRTSAASGRTATSSNDGGRTWHIIGGVEQNLGAFTMGVAAGYSRGESMQMTGAQADNEVSQTAFYGVYRFDNGAYLSAMAGGGVSRISSERRFAEGHLDYRMAGDVSGSIVLASFEGGVNYSLFDGMMITPNFGVRHYSVSTDGYTETGGAETALNIGSYEYERTEARFGARFAGEFKFVNGWSFAPSVDAAMVANLSGDEGGMWANFVEAPDVPFFLQGPSRDDSWGEIATGFRLVRGGTSIGFQAETSVGRQELHEDRYTARISQKF